MTVPPPQSSDPPPMPPMWVDAVLVVLALRHGELVALAGRRGPGSGASPWELPATSVGPEEGLDEVAVRLLAELVGPTPARVEQLAAYGAPGRDPRGGRVAVASVAVLPEARPPSCQVLTSPEQPEDLTTRQARGADPVWLGVDWLLARRRLALDHPLILLDGVERVRRGLESTQLGTAFLTGEFTIAALRGVYESVWGHALDAGNFHRKVTRTPGFVEPTGGRLSEGRGRPAALFRPGPAATLQPPLTRRSLQ